MLFNSFEFLAFFLIVYTTFSVIKNFRWGILLVASYVFYMSWKPEYLILILLSTVVDFFVGKALFASSNPGKRKLLLALSMTTNLSLLFFFKYLGFFIRELLGITADQVWDQWDLVLPVGISFYTFQTMSYTIDIYNRKVSPERHLGFFALFVSFFPQLVAGPIERAGHLLIQLRNNLKVRKENFIPGFKLILVGLFKKVVIADRVALMVDPVYDDPGTYSSPMFILATILFAFQIYCDFSGYSDMAIGLARLFNIELMKNFNAPYFARSIGDFWKRWHISLSTWFRDYLYIPLGGNRVVRWRWSYNILITFLVSGLWHGANWTFIIWGGYHGMLLILEKIAPRFLIWKPIHIGITFVLVCTGWVFFRANTLSDAMYILKETYTHLPNHSLLVNDLRTLGISKLNVLVSFLSILILLLHDSGLRTGSTFTRQAFYVLLFFMIVIFGMDQSQPFIYFQF